jgi:hypothetical protein
MGVPRREPWIPAEIRHCRGRVALLAAFLGALLKGTLYQICA